MGRSWRNLLRRKRDPEEPGAAANAPERDSVTEEAPEAHAPGLSSEEAEAALEVVAPDAAVFEEPEDRQVQGDPAAEAPITKDPVSEAPIAEVAVDETGVTGGLESGESGGWFGRLRKGMRRSRESFVGQLNAAMSEFRDVEDEEFWERIEEILITSDVGVPTTAKLVAELEQEALERNITSGKELRQLMIEHATRLLDKPIELDVSHKPTVILMVGVNGTGKTTNIGKMVHFLPGKVMLAAGDTFRAAAIEQLQNWGERTGARVVARERGADSASVAHEAVEEAKRDGADILLIDTAGRLHTKANLMAELDKVGRVIERVLPGAPHEVLMTVDATTGQNGLRQAKLFHEVAGVTGIILTKLDGTAKGGIALAIANEVGVPIKLISVGEHIGDLHPFEAREFAQALFGEL
ncbi:MAG: signal recognition particle-docking protein FtsY [Rubrobacteraceae bacterium]